MGALLARREGAARRRDDKRTVWVLDTETKGTGADMVQAPFSAKAAIVPEPRVPRRFKVVGVMSGEVAADGVGSREAIEALRAFPTVFDARIHVWEPEDEEWRLLTLAEKKAMWAFREDA